MENKGYIKRRYFIQVVTTTCKNNGNFSKVDAILKRRQQKQGEKKMEKAGERKMKEEWKDIKGYEGLYQVSDLGRVKSLNYRHKNTEMVLKPQVTGKGYLRVQLHKNGIFKSFFAHRLVAEAFIPNPNNLLEINHKNEIKTDNNVENLEWCDAKHNANYGTRNNKIAMSKIGHKCNHSRPVECYDKKMNLISTFESSYDAMRKTGVNADNIRRCCRNEKYRHTAGGFIWKEVME